MKEEYKYQKEAAAAMEAGRLEDALQWYDYARKQTPDNPDILNDRAVCLFHLGRKEDALADLNKGVEMQPDYSYRYSSRAYLRSALKDIDGAIEDYKKAISLDPEDAIAHNNLGLLEEQLGYMKQAQDRYKVADELRQILDDNNIEQPEKPEPRNIQREIDQEAPADTSTRAHVREVGKTIRKKEEWQGFLRFVKNGFRLPKE